MANMKSQAQIEAAGADGTSNDPVFGIARLFGDAKTAVEAVEASVATKADTSAVPSTEQIQDLVAAMLVAGSGVSLSYNDAAGTLTITASGGGGGLDAEGAQDAVGTIMAGAGLASVAYDDAAGTITVTVTSESVQDVVGALLTAGSGITLNYNDAGDVLTVTNADRGSTAVTTHEAAGDPHPQYETSAEAAAKVTAHAAAADPHGDRAYADSAVSVHTGDTSDAHEASAISVDASGFNGNLAGTDDTVQKVAQKLDDLTVGGGGGSLAVENEGTELSAAATRMDFVGRGVNATEPATDEISVSIKGAPANWIDVRDYGAVPDMKNCDGSITSGTNIFNATLSGTPFVAGDVGKTIVIAGAGTAGADLVTTISGYTDSDTVTLTANASTSATNNRAVFGTINTTAINNAISACDDGSVLYFPGGPDPYLTAGGHTIAKQITVRGDGCGGSYDAAAGTSRIVTTSGSNVCFTVSKNCVNWQDLTIGYYALPDVSGGETGTTPTAGALIQVTGTSNSGGAWATYRNLGLYGGWINLDIQCGAQWHVEGGFNMNAKKFGLKAAHAGFPDFGLGKITGVDFAANTGYAWGHPDAQIKWEGGGGFLVQGCGITGGTYSIHVDNLTSTLTSQIIIAKNGFEDYAESGVYVNGSTGTLWNVNVIGNSFGHYESSAVGDPAIRFAGVIAGFSISDNVGWLPTTSPRFALGSSVTDGSVGGNQGMFNGLPGTFTAGNRIDFKKNTLRVRATKSANQSYSQTTTTAVTFNTEVFKDRTGMHSTSTNTERFINDTGATRRCRLSGAVQIGGTGLTQTYVSIIKNSATGIKSTLYADAPDSTNAFFLVDSGWVDLANNDYLKLELYTNSGSSLLVNADNTFLVFEVEDHD